MENFLIIGNKLGLNFKRFDKTITLKALLESDHSLQGNKLIPSQYLTKCEISALNNFCHKKQIKHYLNKDSYPVAESKLTHKQQQANSLISIPAQISADQFYADIWINGENEFLQDHITGYHIQGMVLIEAVRQMFIAVSEKFYPRSWRKDAYIIIHELNSKFHHFTFPLNLLIKQRNLNIKERNKSILFESEFHIIQNDTVTFTANAIYSIYESSVLISKEKTKAQESINKFLSQGE